MAEVIGQNTPNGEKLMGYVAEVERIEAQVKELGDIKKAIFARAKAEGYVPAGIKYVVKMRKKKPQVREEEESTRDIYMHAAGMATEPPIYRQIAVLAKDTVSGERLLEAMKQLVPQNGEIICTIGGKRMRLWRDKDAAPQASEYVPVEAGSSIATRSTLPPAKSRDVPNCTPAEAEELGRQCYRDNRPIIDNPFPFDDERRPRFDEGYRKESGTHGMGPK